MPANIHVGSLYLCCSVLGVKGLAMPISIPPQMSSPGLPGSSANSPQAGQNAPPSKGPSLPGVSFYSSIKELANFTYKYAGHFWNYHSNIGKFIADANNANRARARSQEVAEKPDIVHCRTDEDLHRILSKQAIGEPDHTIAVFRVKGNHNQAVSIFKTPEPDAKISCIALDSCEFKPPGGKEPWNWFDKAVLTNACNKWEKILEKYPNSEVIVTTLGNQTDYTSCGEFAVSGAKKLQDFREDVGAIHREHIQQTLAAPRHHWRTYKVRLTNELGFLANANKRLLAKLFVHDGSREHVQEISDKYDLHEVDLKKPEQRDPSAPYNLLRRFDEQKGSSIYRKRDEWLEQMSLKKDEPDEPYAK